MFVDSYFRLQLIESDVDDNKFVDCAFAADATYIVSDDKHFDILANISFPQILVLKLKEFLNRGLLVILGGKIFGNADKYLPLQHLLYI